MSLISGVAPGFLELLLYEPNIRGCSWFSGAPSL